MRKVIGLLVIAALLAACGPKITTMDQAFQLINDLDDEFGADFRKEKVNTLNLERPELKKYITRVEELQKQVKGVDDKNEKQINWLFTMREMMLKAQYNFQDAWLGIGVDGRVSDGFKCSDAPYVQEATLLLEESWQQGTSSTKFLDSILTERPDLAEEIGINEDRPLIYDSGFDKIYLEVKSNVVAMKSFCNVDIKTNHFNFTDILKNITDREAGNNG